MAFLIESSTGSGGVSIVNTGVDDFGPLLARQAELVFGPRQVSVVSANSTV
jgi:hypothetical protein